MNNKLDISVVVPLYNEAESLPELVAWIDRVAVSHGYAYEVILVDDGSSDGSWEVVESLREKYPPQPKARSSSRWMPTCRIRPTRFPNCAA